MEQLWQLESVDLSKQNWTKMVLSGTLRPRFVNSSQDNSVFTFSDNTEPHLYPSCTERTTQH